MPSPAAVYANIARAARPSVRYEHDRHGHPVRITEAMTADEVRRLDRMIQVRLAVRSDFDYDAVVRTLRPSLHAVALQLQEARRQKLLLPGDEA